MGKRFVIVLCGMCALLANTSQLQALTLDSTGKVTDWGVVPFGAGSTYDRVVNHNAWKPVAAPYGTHWQEENNYSPIGYPVHGHTPSPGLPGGEIYDMEAVYLRINRGLAEDSLQVLVVTSMPTHTYSSKFNYHYRIGDLFIDLQGDGVLDYAVTTTDWDDCQPWQAYDVVEKKYVAFDHTGTPGSLYAISYDTMTVIDPDDPNCQVVTGVGNNAVSGLYGGNADLAYVEEMFRPWVVDEGKLTANLLGTVGLLSASYNYGNKIGGGYYLLDPNWSTNGIMENEGPTWLYEYTIPLSLLSGTLDETNLMFLSVSITTECGNDVIRTISGGGNGGGYEPPVPEPFTLTGLVLGLCGIGGYLRRRRVR